LETNVKKREMAEKKGVYETYRASEEYSKALELHQIEHMAVH
jgi:hypothetical protein